MPGELSKDEAARSHVQAAQDARDLRVKRFFESGESDTGIGEALRYLVTGGGRPEILRDVDIKRRRDERLADRPIDREMKQRTGKSKAWRTPTTYRRGSVR